jgi:hypothetical protein
MLRLASSETIIKGILDHKDLASIWKDVPSSYHTLLLECAEKLDLIFNASMHQSKIASLDHVTHPMSLVPFALEESPDVTAMSKFESVKLKIVPSFSFDRIWTFSQIPSDFFSKILVKILQSTNPNFFWKNGLVTYDDTYCLCLDYSFATSTLHLSIRGSENCKSLARLFVQIISIFLSQRYSQCVKKVMVPCPHHLQEGLAFYSFELSELEHLVSQGIMYAYCDDYVANRIGNDDVIISH